MDFLLNNKSKLIIKIIKLTKDKLNFINKFTLWLFFKYYHFKFIRILFKNKLSKNIPNNFDNLT
jgi:hypothetical protein